MPRKYRKQNWVRVDIRPRDKRLIKTVGDEGFVRRDHAIEHIFEGKKPYAKNRIRKLKKFGYLQAISIKAGDPESYLLGPEGIPIVRGFYPIGLRGWGCPGIQTSIDFGSYEHSLKVTKARLLLENMKFCKNWKSERMLRAGTKGGHKVPDGFFVPDQKGIAVEVELKRKKASSYEKIFEIYDRDPKIHYVLYICGDLPLLLYIQRLVKKALPLKKYLFLLYDDLVRLKENAVVRVDGREFPLKKVLG